MEPENYTSGFVGSSEENRKSGGTASGDTLSPIGEVVSSSVGETAGNAAVDSPSGAPEAPVRFQTTVRERILAWLALPLAFCYVTVYFELLSGVFMPEGSPETAIKIWLAVFVVGFMAFGEVLHWKEKRSFESILWMVAEFALLAAFLFNLGSVWKQGHLFLFLHLFAGYWLLARGRRLAEVNTSHMFLWDGITAFFVLPFKSFPLHVRALVSTFVYHPNAEKKRSKLVALFIVLAVAIGLALLFIAVSLLITADNKYWQMIHDIFSFLHIEWDEQLIAKIFLTLLFVPYLYGMLAGTLHEEKERFYARGNLIKKGVSKLNKIPAAVWCAFIGIFMAFYIAFFVIQGSYFFNAFRFVLPEATTYSEYARQGFGEMIGVMIINFILLWLATRTSAKKPAILKVFCMILLCSSVLFALIASLKIYMYIKAFGFTPLRLQSVWATFVLLFACICAMISLLSGKKTARVWFIGSAVSLVALAFV